MPSSLQQTAGVSKAAKFVNANPLDPMLRPFANSNDDMQAAALADKVNQRLEMDRAAGNSNSGARNVAPAMNAATSYRQQQQQPTMMAVPQRPSPAAVATQDVDFNNQRQAASNDSDSDDDSWLDDNGDDDTTHNDPILQAIRQRRLQELQQQHSQRMEHVAKGHGELRTISQDDFLPECTSSSEFVVTHFFHNEYQRCHILDHHLQKIAASHLECKFLRLDAEKAPFFVAKLSVRTLPTLLVFQHGKLVDRMTGFDKVMNDNNDNPDEWKTTRLQEWLASTGAIQYTKPAEATNKDGHRVGYRSRIYRGDCGNVDDDDDYC